MPGLVLLREAGSAKGSSWNFWRPFARTLRITESECSVFYCVLKEDCLLPRRKKATPEGGLNTTFLNTADPKPTGI